MYIYIYIDPLFNSKTIPFHSRNDGNAFSLKSRITVAPVFPFRYDYV